MAELKTKATDASVDEFIASVPDATRRADAKQVLALMREVTGEQGRMWGPSIVGFVDYRLQYPNGRELDWFKIGFSPRKQNMTLYVINNTKKQQDLLTKLGKHTTSKVCLYINKLSDVDLNILRQVIASSLS